jgi:hypothetical protein
MYRRGSCRDSDGWMSVDVNGFEAHESICRVLSAAAISNSGDYQVNFVCAGEGHTWTWNVRMSLSNGRLRLTEEQ